MWKQRAKELKREVYALYFACRDPRMPWYAKALAVGIVAYAFSPIDLIPDFIPILGYLDDLVLISLGVIAPWFRLPFWRNAGNGRPRWKASLGTGPPLR